MSEGQGHYHTLLAVLGGVASVMAIALAYKEFQKPDTGYSWIILAIGLSIVFVPCCWSIVSALRKRRVRQVSNIWHPGMDREAVLVRLDGVLSLPADRYDRMRHQGVPGWPLQDLSEMTSAFRLAILTYTPPGDDARTRMEDIARRYSDLDADRHREMLEYRGIVEELRSRWERGAIGGGDQTMEGP